MKIELEASDLQEMRDAVEGNIDFEPTDEQLRKVTESRQLLGLAVMWSWGDTEVRSDLVEALEKVKVAEEAELR